MILLVLLLALSIVYLLDRNFTHRFTLADTSVLEILFKRIQLKVEQINRDKTPSKFFKDTWFVLQGLVISLKNKSWSEGVFSKELDHRKKLLGLALSPLGLWPVFIFCLLVLNVPGLYISGVVISLILIFKLFKKDLHASMLLFFCLGISLFLFEHGLRTSSQILMQAHEYDWIFFLSQSPIQNTLILFVLALILTVIFKIELLFFILALVFMSSGLLAFNNALALVSGELAGLFVVFLIKAKHDFHIRFYAGLGLFLCLLNFILALVFKAEIFGMNLGQILQAQVRMQALIYFYLSFFVIWTGLTLVLGHFISAKVATK